MVAKSLDILLKFIAHVRQFVLQFLYSKSHVPGFFGLSSSGSGFSPFARGDHLLFLIKQEFRVPLGAFCFLGHLFHLLRRRVLVPIGLLDTHRLSVEFIINAFVLWLYPNRKPLDIFALLTKASANDI